MNTTAGIVDIDGSSVTFNRIFNSSFWGILLQTSVAAVQGNSITSASNGINFVCSVNNNVHANTFVDVGTGLFHVPSAVSTSNSYFNVGTIRSGC